MNQILVVSKQVDLNKLLETETRNGNFRIEFLSSAEQVLPRLRARSYPLLIIDLDLIPDSARQSGALYAACPNTAVLLLTPPKQRAAAVEQLAYGAADYLLLPVNLAELTLKIDRQIKVQRLKQEKRPSFAGESGSNELHMLNRITQEIIQTLHPDEALEIILSRAQLITNVEITKIWLADHNENLDPRKSLTRTTLSRPSRRENDFLFDLAQQTAARRQVIFREKSADSDWPGQTLKAALLLPLISREKLLGVVALASLRMHSFSANQTEWLLVFCQQAAIALENARLFHDLSSAYIDLDQSREKILRHHNTLQVLFDGITDGLYILNKDLSINALNQVEAERQGKSADELVGKKFTSLRGAKAAPGLVDRINEALKTGQETTWISSEEEQELFLKNREFRIYPIRHRLSPSNEQVVIFAQDVSERRQLQASLFRSANLVAVGQLAGSVAHQINNPLTVTIINSQLLREETSSDSESYDLADEILKAGKRIENIVKNLLDFSNQKKYEFLETDLIASIEDALELVSNSLKKANIRVLKDYQARPLLIASVSHLKLVWVNLLLNAHDAVQGYTDQPVIRLATQMVSDQVVKVMITDNGVGLSYKEMERIFRPFYTTKPPGKALGLGLYAAHAIVDCHDGQIHVFSEPGVNTTFEVMLPLEQSGDLQTKNLTASC